MSDSEDDPDYQPSTDEESESESKCSDHNLSEGSTITSKQTPTSTFFRTHKISEYVDCLKISWLIDLNGAQKMPKISDYWSTDVLYENNVAKKVMSRNRFEILLRCWHFEDAYFVGMSGADRLIKIRQFLTINETMVAFRGRIAFMQYIPGKRHKCGINVSAAYYTSVTVANNLLQQNSHLLGTLRKNRKGPPKEILKEKLKKGETCVMENNDGVLVLRWKDKRDVLALSTRHTPGYVNVRSRRNRNKVTMKLGLSKGICGISHKRAELGVEFVTPLELLAVNDDVDGSSCHCVCCQQRKPRKTSNTLTS
ncbi:hypothetical protein ABMA27_007814 [Loxostege sticticalis]|uniref:PiggyBac transposable element-derived protein domain-containing protein n=1 Tax=Loxostege sticticalis TaxID=481309 RepID=A0ABR3HCZ1_LOXSC